MEPSWIAIGVSALSLVLVFLGQRRRVRRDIVIDMREELDDTLKRLTRCEQQQHLYEVAIKRLEELHNTGGRRDERGDRSPPPA